MTQLQLARALGVDAKNIGNWERGAHAPRGERVVGIAEATGHDIEFFYVEGDSDEEDEEAALRRAARDLLAPLNDSMVDALMAEIRLRVGSRV